MAFKKNKSSKFKGKKEYGVLIPVGALWQRTDTLLSGTFDRDSSKFLNAIADCGINDLRVTVLDNDYKKTDKHPDYRVFVSSSDPNYVPHDDSEEADEEEEEEAPAPKKKASKKKKASLPWE